MGFQLDHMTFMEIYQEIISMVTLLLLLIQEEQWSVTDKSTQVLINPCPAE